MFKKTKMIGKILLALVVVGTVSASHGYWLLAAFTLTGAIAGSIYFRPHQSTTAPPLDRCPTVQTAKRTDLWVVIDPAEWMLINFSDKTAVRLNRLSSLRPLRIEMDHRDDIFHIDMFNRATVTDSHGRPIKL